MKELRDLTVRSVERPRADYVLLRLTDDKPLPTCQPGQFVEVRADGSPTTFLRRPISINFFDETANEVWLLIHEVGDGTRALGRLREGDVVNCLLPLGKGFYVPSADNAEGACNKVPTEKLRFLLIGGGVGTAPLLYYGKILHALGSDVTFLLGGRSEGDILQRDLFARYGRVCCTTEDGSLGTQGFVTNHDVLAEDFHAIAMCGPKPMMKAVVGAVRSRDVHCEASLENMMACGLGACLCCVEKTVRGNLCVCKDGPVFNINDLTW